MLLESNLDDDARSKDFDKQLCIQIHIFRRKNYSQVSVCNKVMLYTSNTNYPAKIFWTS